MFHRAVERLFNKLVCTSLPTERDFDPVGGDLDAQCAWKNFGGLKLEEASAKFKECPTAYQEDFMFMGGKAFAFYFPVIDQFLRKTIELPPDQHGDRESWILPQCIKQQFAGQALQHVLPLKQTVLELCDFMLQNIDLFAEDWPDLVELKSQWQQLKDQVSQCMD